MYAFLNAFFFAFHTALILFNVLGWISKRTRRLNLITLSLTGLSWGLLGIWYGFGYCPSTDWHWQVRRQLGYHDMPRSYIKFLVDALTGIDLAPQLVNSGTLIVFLLALGTSGYLNARDRKRSREQFKA